MCRQRVAVEWGFGILKNTFKMLTFKVGKDGYASILVVSQTFAVESEGEIAACCIVLLCGSSSDEFAFLFLWKSGGFFLWS